MSRAVDRDLLSHVPANDSIHQSTPGRVPVTARLSPRPTTNIVFQVSDPEAGMVFARSLGSAAPREPSPQQPAPSASQPAPAAGPAPQHEDPFAMHLIGSARPAGKGGARKKLAMEDEIESWTAGAYPDFDGDVARLAPASGAQAPVAPAGSTGPAPQLRAAPDAEVEPGGVGIDSPAACHVAAAGFEGTPESMPHAGAIQAAFGRHDISHIEAHVGGAAAAASDQLGALAYAAGDRVGFRETPDLHTAAHEAAHVIQQRSGLRAADGGGTRDDHERHADAVADAVVGGRSAEGLLDQYAGGADCTAAVQLKEPGSSPMFRDAAVLEVPEPLKEAPDHVRGGLARLKALPTATMENVDASYVTFVGRSRELEGGINGALAADKANAVEVETGVRNAVTMYQTQRGIMTKSLADIDAGTQDAEGLGQEVSGILATRASDEKKAGQKDKEASDTAKEEAAINEAYADYDTMAQFAIDCIATGAKYLISPEDAAGELVDLAGAAFKNAASSLIDDLKKDALEAKRTQLQQRFAGERSKINAENAAAVSQWTDGIKAQISAARTRTEAAGQAYKAAVKLAAQSLVTILKAKSSSTTLAAIQAYVNEITPAGDQIKHDAHGLAATLDAAQIPLWAEVTAKWAAEAKDRYPGPYSPEAIAQRKQKLEALVTFTATAAANVEQNGSWFESISGEIGSGIYMEPANRGMELMMSLVGAVPTAPQ